MKPGGKLQQSIPIWDQSGTIRDILETYQKLKENSNYKGLRSGGICSMQVGLSHLYVSTYLSIK